MDSFNTTPTAEQAEFTALDPVEDLTTLPNVFPDEEDPYYHILKVEMEEFAAEHLKLKEAAHDMEVLANQVKTLLADLGIEINGEWSAIRLANVSLKVSKKLFSKAWQQGFKTTYAGLIGLINKYSTTLEQQFGDVAGDYLPKKSENNG